MLDPHVAPVVPEIVEDLFVTDPDLWRGIKAAVRQSFQKFDRLLLRVHDYRSRAPSPDRRDAIRRFLAIAYMLSKDVRYFNEFKWFSDKRRDDLTELMAVEFRENLYDGVHHVFPLASPEEVRATVARRRSAQGESHPPQQPLRIGLLGAPHNFVHLFDELRAEGHTVHSYYFPHSNSPCKRAFKRSPMIFRPFFRLAGVSFPYEVVPFAPRDDRITDPLTRAELDLGIHCLPFIIRRNLIRAFSHGILNDHLAILPYVRGRSSVEYSLLFDHPIGATTHLIDEGIDTGGILEYHTYDADQFAGKTIAQVKRFVESRREERFLQTVRRDPVRSLEPIANPRERGLQYYSMHADLRRHVQARILRPR